jgi:hypothetical protein
MEQKIITRKEALAQGRDRYYTGERCKRNHRATRYTSTRACTVCDRVSSRRWSQENPERRRENNRRWYAENREKAREHSRRWRRANPDHHAALVAKRRALQRAPGCVPEGFDLDATIPFYREARRLTRETGIPHEVDHILALSAGGTHEAANLQVLTAAENRAKRDAEDRPLIERYKAQHEQAELQTA